MIIVTVLRDKLIHSETIRENQTIKSDQSDDIWWSRFRVQFTFAPVNNILRTINALFTKVKSNDIKVLCNLPGRSARQISQAIRLGYLFIFLSYVTGLKVNWAPNL